MSWSFTSESIEKILSEVWRSRESNWKKKQAQEYILCCTTPKPVRQQRSMKNSKMIIKGTTVYSRLQIPICRKDSALKKTRDTHMLVTCVHISWTKSLASAGGQSFLEIHGVASTRRRHDGVAAADSLPNS